MCAYELAVTAGTESLRIDEVCVCIRARARARASERACAFHIWCVQAARQCTIQH